METMTASVRNVDEPQLLAHRFADVSRIRLHDVD
jgi:hypothetical protein